MSRTVDPAEIPNICVCTAPAIPTVHKSELDMLIFGEIADGGGDFTVVSFRPVEFIVLFDVDSVMMGSFCAHPIDVIIIKLTAIASFFSIFSPYNNYSFNAISIYKKRTLRSLIMQRFCIVAELIKFLLTCLQHMKQQKL